MADSKVARRYAQALLELCDEAKNHAVISKQLDTFVATYKASDDLQSVLRNPVLDVDTKKKVVDAAFKKALFAPTTKNFLNVLLDHERMGAVVEIHDQFKTMLASRSKVLEATIVSAQALRKADLDSISKELGRITGRKIDVTAEVDPTLIGGVVVQVGNVLLDGSVRTDLDMLREQLLGA